MRGFDPSTLGGRLLTRGTCAAAASDGESVETKDADVEAVTPVAGTDDWVDMEGEARVIDAVTSLRTPEPATSIGSALLAYLVPPVVVDVPLLVAEGGAASPLVEIDADLRFSLSSVIVWDSSDAATATAFRLPPGPEALAAAELGVAAPVRPGDNPPKLARPVAVTTPVVMTPPSGAGGGLGSWPSSESPDSSEDCK